METNKPLYFLSIQMLGEFQTQDFVVVVFTDKVIGTNSAGISIKLEHATTEYTLEPI